ncbi:MAG: probable metal-dependent peptidase [uncultured Thermomicrobiales bacterium]|uniref:Probable metal-dependent peptidase n=1 Tax=uncultured Thermomicrobiales bacterium TaxID=1645740 RepID=A0A6J4VJE3_9BACT|nr:MAG: probable metal-dependent peptidase [uncultured Thermomicrobiales bacterium]
MFFDLNYFLFVLIPGLLLMGLAQWRLRSTFAKYRQIANSRGLTGAQAAEAVMRAAGVYDVGIEPIAGELTDHFDPRAKMLRLSEPVYSGRSIAAIGVAAHEAGHAVQQNVSYAPMSLRSGLVPVANLGSGIAPFIILGGLWTQITGLAWIGVILFAGATLFALVTLPVEYNASARARTLLAESGLVTRDEYGDVQKMLNAAALTYVAGFAASALQLLYYVMLVTGMGGRQRDE